MRASELAVRDQVLVRVDGREKPGTVRGFQRTPRPRASTHTLVAVELTNGHLVRLHPRLVLRRLGSSAIHGRGSRGADAQTREG